MNILHAGDKLPMQSGFSKNSACSLLPALRFLGGLYNFCNFVIIFSLKSETIFGNFFKKIMKNAFYFTLKVPFVLKIFKFFVTTFWSYRKNGLIRRKRLISKFMLHAKLRAIEIY